jgi:hypothetical protein
MNPFGFMQGGIIVAANITKEIVTTYKWQLRL